MTVREVMAATVSVLYLSDYVECCGDPNCLCSEAKGRLSLSPPLSPSLSVSPPSPPLSLSHTPLSSALSASHPLTYTLFPAVPEKKKTLS